MRPGSIFILQNNSGVQFNARGPETALARIDCALT